MPNILLLNFGHLSAETVSFENKKKEIEYFKILKTSGAFPFLHYLIFGLILGTFADKYNHIDLIFLTAVIRTLQVIVSIISELRL